MGQSVTAPPPTPPDQTSLTITAGKLAIKAGGVTDAKITAPLLSATLANSPSNGKYIQTDGTNNSWASPGSAVISTTTVTGSAVGSVNITGLVAGANYLVLFNLKGAGSGDTAIKLKWNSTDYAKAYDLVAAGGTLYVDITGGKIGNCGAAATDVLAGQIYIDTTTARKSANSQAAIYSGNNTQCSAGYVESSDTTTAQTSFTIYAASGNAIDVGSTIKLIKLG